MATTVTQSEVLAKRARASTHIPAARTMLTDAKTPLSVYANLAIGPRSFLFESLEGVSAGVAIL